MKKSLTVALLALLFVALLMSSACAATAVPNQDLHFRTGPNTHYADLYRLPQSTGVEAIECEAGNGVTWVLLQFMHNGKVERAYTGLKRVDVTGVLPFANNAYYNAFMTAAKTVYAAPYDNAAVRGQVGQEEMVTYLHTEGDYDYIEFYDSGSKAVSRGWVDTNCVRLTQERGGYAVAGSDVYATPTLSGAIGRIGENEIIGVMGSGSDYYQIVFYSARENTLLQGYVSKSVVSAY